MSNKFHSRSFILWPLIIWRCLDNVPISRFIDISLRASGLPVINASEALCDALV
jgi:hypothetical protein